LDYEGLTAIEEFVDYVHFGDSTNKCDSTWRSSHAFVPGKLLSGGFDRSYYEYLQAGAFVRYLTTRFGIEKVKAFYRASGDYDSYALGDSYASIFGESLQKSIDSFQEQYLAGWICGYSPLGSHPSY
jgi:hypothetical protein